MSLLLLLVLSIFFAVGATADCKFKGRTYKNGAEFKLAHPCIVYWCNSGHINVKEKGCYIYGRCYPFNKVLEIRCSTYKCRLYKFKGNVYVEFKWLKGTCVDFKGRCFKPGQLFVLKNYGNHYFPCSCKFAPKVDRMHYFCHKVS